MPAHLQTPASLKWYAIYADAPDGDAGAEVPPEGDLLARFDMAALLGRIGRRSVRAMWIIDHATNQVFRIYGAVPSWIAERHHGLTEKKPPAPSLSPGAGLAAAAQALLDAPGWCSPSYGHGVFARRR